MNREPWVAYLVVIGVVAAIMYGKYLMASGDANSSNDSKDENSR